MLGERTKQQSVSFTMGTDCVPLHADLFLYSYQWQSSVVDPFLPSYLYSVLKHTFRQKLNAI